VAAYVPTIPVNYPNDHSSKDERKTSNDANSDDRCGRRKSIKDTPTKVIRKTAVDTCKRSHQETKEPKKVGPTFKVLSESI